MGNEKIIVKKNFALYLFSITINNIGDIIFDLFITWSITQSTGKILSAVYLMGTSIAFRAILALFLGSIVDRYNKKTLIIISHISSIIIILTFSFCWNWVLNNIGIGILFILANDINNELFRRCYITMSAEIFPANTYIKFQSTSMIINRVVSILGTSISGFLIAYLDSTFIFEIDIITYIISLLLLMQISYTYKNTVDSEKTISFRANFKNIINDIKYALKSIINSKYILSFTILMFILNMAYGYIPNIMPIYISNNLNSPTLLGFIKSAMTIGEIIGLAVVTKLSSYVSKTFKVSMIGNAILMFGMLYINNLYLIILIFAMYGFFDSLTQPLFSYTVTLIEEKNRGKILGGIDAIILFSPSIGMYLITQSINLNVIAGTFILVLIFVAAYLIISLNKSLHAIKL